MRRRPTARLRLELLEDRSVPSATDLISIGLNGAPADQSSFSPSLSADGRYVAFTSQADNLVPGDTNDAEDVFLRDRMTGTTELVSGAADSGAGDLFGPSIHYNVTISADGNEVAFLRMATHLVNGQSQATSDLFVWDRLTGGTRAVAVAGSPAGTPSLSADGRFVAFTAMASDYYHSDAYVTDLQTGASELLSAGLNGLPTHLSGAPSLSADGRYAAFVNATQESVPGDNSTAFTEGVFVRDRLMGTTQAISIPAALQQIVAGAGQTVSLGTPLISGDGRVVAFSALARDASANPYDGWRAIGLFVQDRTDNVTETIPMPNGGTGEDSSVLSSVSGDGRFVAFSYDPHPPGDAIRPGEMDNKFSVVWDRQSGAERAIAAPSNQLWGGNDPDPSPVISDNGRYVALASQDVQQDENGFFESNVKVIDLTDPNAPVSIAFPAYSATMPPATSVPITDVIVPPVSSGTANDGSVPVSTGTSTSPAANAIVASLALPSSGLNLALFLAPDVESPASDIASLTSGSSIGPRKSGSPAPDTGRTNATPPATATIGDDLITTRARRESFLSLDPTLNGTLAR